MKRRTFFLSVTLAMILQINSGKISSQNVAITNDATFTTPQSILHLYRNADGSLLQLSNPTTTAGVNRGLYFTATLNDFSLINNEAGSLSFHTSNTQRAIILSTGQFGINMTPVMMLDVTSASTTAGDAAIRGASTGNAAVYGVQGTISSITLNAAGVYGYASGNAQVFGVYGSLPASNITANASGVRGYVPASAGNVYGVFGESAATGASSAGIRGLTTGNNGTGVYAQAQGAGTSYAFRGTATGAGTTNYAAYLSASGATTNYGLFVNAGGVRFVPLASGANGAVLRTNNTGDLVITNFSGSAGDVLLGTGAFGPATTSGTAWQLAGNTLVGTEFIGSTNAQPFIIRTNNTERARVLSGGNVLFNRTTALYATDMFEVQGDATFPDAISGYTNQPGGSGIYGENSSSTGTAIYAINSAVSGAGTTGHGLWGQTAQSGSVGTVGRNTNTGGTGLYGDATAATGFGTGVVGLVSSPTGDGAYFANIAANGASVGFGAWAESNQTGGAAFVATLQSSGSYFSGTSVSALTNSSIAGGKGIIGACNNATGVGVQGQTSGATGIGVVGVSSGAGISYGVFGQNTGANVGAVALFGQITGAGSGTSFLQTAVRKDIFGAGNGVAGNYHFGVYGAGGISTRSGGVMGHDAGSAFYAAGALGYYSGALADVAVYGFGQAHTTGVAGGYIQQQNDDRFYASLSEKGGPNMQNNVNLSYAKEDEVRFSSWSCQEPNNMIGLGIYGGVMGGWIKGLVYGANFSGAKYGAYVHGKTITNNIIATLNEVDGSDDRVPTFAPSSMKVDVTDRGKSKLENGKAVIEFEKNFASLISREEPVTITVTPLGASKGLYIEQSSINGFVVVENDGGTSNAEFNWIAIAVKKGFEKINISPEIIASDFEDKINGDEGVMYNDNNPATPLYFLWYDGKQVRFDKPPASITQRKSVDIGVNVPSLFQYPDKVNNLNNFAKEKVLKIKEITTPILKAKEDIKVGDNPAQ